jgi:hypothetical protein
MKRYADDARAFVLQTQDKSFDYRDTPMLANGTEPRFDIMPVTPMLKRIAPELLALIADEVFRCGTGVVDSALKEGLNRYRCGIVPVCCNAHHSSRLVVDDHRHPLAKRPVLR